MSYLAHPKTKQDNMTDRDGNFLIYEVREMKSDGLSKGFQNPHGFVIASIEILDDVNALFTAESLSNAFASLLNNGDLSKPVFEKTDDITILFHKESDKSATLRTLINGKGNSIETAKITILANNIEFSPDLISKFCGMVNATPKSPDKKPKNLTP